MALSSKVGVLFAGVLLIKALFFGVHIRASNFGRSSHIRIIEDLTKEL